MILDRDRKGTVATVVIEKGIGFIHDAIPRPRRGLYFNSLELRAPLVFGEELQGQQVVFDKYEGSRGPQAVNVRAAT